MEEEEKEEVKGVMETTFCFSGNEKDETEEADAERGERAREGEEEGKGGDERARTVKSGTK